MRNRWLGRDRCGETEREEAWRAKKTGGVGDNVVCLGVLGATNGEQVCEKICF